MHTIFQKLSLKDEPLHTVNAAYVDELAKFAEVLKKINENFDVSYIMDTTKPLKKLSDKMQAFLDTHCRERHYLFSMKRCGSNNCVCGIVRLGADVFKDPKPSGSDADKFAKFQDVYGRNNSEEGDKYLPSKNEKLKERGMSFSPSAQKAKNTNLVWQCEECLRWRCIYSQKRLSKAERTEAMQLLEMFSYSCGSSLNDIHCFEDDEDTVLAKLQTILRWRFHITPFFVKSHCAIIVVKQLYSRKIQIAFPSVKTHEKGLKLQQKPRRSIVIQNISSSKLTDSFMFITCSE